LQALKSECQKPPVKDWWHVAIAKVIRGFWARSEFHECICGWVYETTIHRDGGIPTFKN